MTARSILPPPAADRGQRPRHNDGEHSGTRADRPAEVALLIGNPARAKVKMVPSMTARCLMSR